MTSESEDDLRTTADELAADAERLTEIERQKAELDPQDPAVQDLAAEATRIAERLNVGARAQEALSREAASKTPSEEDRSSGR